MSDEVMFGVRERAKALFGLWANGQWEDVRRDFDDTMAERLSAEGVEAAWRQVTDAVGAYRRAGEPTVHQHPEYTVVDLPLEFADRRMKGRVTYRPNGQVAGLFILTPEAV